MAAPILEGTQSVLNPAQWSAFGFTPLCANAPTSWSATTLPPGLSINTSTGLVSGVPTVPGVYPFYVSAFNGDGSSVAKYVIAVSAGAPTNSPWLDVSFDVVSRQVTLSIGIAPGQASAIASSAAPSDVPAPLATVKLADDLMLNVTLVKNGTVLDLTATDVAFSVKDSDQNRALASRDGWAKLGSGSGTSYLIHTLLAGNAIKGAIADGQFISTATLICAIKVSYSNSLHSTVGPVTAVFESDDFALRIVKSLN